MAPRDKLYHAGIKGMRWGVRKKEETGGGSGGSKKPTTSPPNPKSSTDESKPAAAPKKAPTHFLGMSIDHLKAESARKKPLSQMSNQEIKDYMARVQLEAQYRATMPVSKMEQGKKILGGILVRVGTRAVETFLNGLVDKQIQGYMAGFGEKKKDPEPAKKDPDPKQDNKGAKPNGKTPPVNNPVKGPSPSAPQNPGNSNQKPQNGSKPTGSPMAPPMRPQNASMPNVPLPNIGSSTIPFPSRPFGAPSFRPIPQPVRVPQNGTNNQTTQSKPKDSWTNFTVTPAKPQAPNVGPANSKPVTIEGKFNTTQPPQGHVSPIYPTNTSSMWNPSNTSAPITSVVKNLVAPMLPTSTKLLGQPQHVNPILQGVLALPSGQLLLGDGK